MNKPTKNISIPPRRRQAKTTPTPVIVPSPAVIRRLLPNVLSRHGELLLLVLLQVFLGLRPEEANRALSETFVKPHQNHE